MVSLTFTLSAFCLISSLALANAGCNLSRDPNESFEISTCSIEELTEFFTESEVGNMPPYGSECERSEMRFCKKGECEDADPMSLALAAFFLEPWKLAKFYTREKGGPAKFTFKNGLSIPGKFDFATYPFDNKKAIRGSIPIINFAHTYGREIYPGLYFGTGSTNSNYNPGGFWSISLNSRAPSPPTLFHTIYTKFMTEAYNLNELKEFASRGGIGACIAKKNVLAQENDELMFLTGEKITVLEHIANDIYLGYCEGVIGRFSASQVYFIELDPQVLKSLHAWHSVGAREKALDSSDSESEPSSNIPPPPLRRPPQPPAAIASKLDVDKELPTPPPAISPSPLPRTHGREITENPRSSTLSNPLPKRLSLFGNTTSEATATRGEKARGEETKKRASSLSPSTTSSQGSIFCSRTVTFSSGDVYGSCAPPSKMPLQDPKFEPKRSSKHLSSVSSSTATTMVNIPSSHSSRHTSWRSSRQVPTSPLMPSSPPPPSLSSTSSSSTSSQEDILLDTTILKSLISKSRVRPSNIRSIDSPLPPSNSPWTTNEGYLRYRKITNPIKAEKIPLSPSIGPTRLMTENQRMKKVQRKRKIKSSPPGKLPSPPTTPSTRTSVDEGVGSCSENTEADIENRLSFLSFSSFDLEKNPAKESLGILEISEPLISTKAASSAAAAPTPTTAASAFSNPANNTSISTYSDEEDNTPTPRVSFDLHRGLSDINLEFDDLDTSLIPSSWQQLHPEVPLRPETPTPSSRTSRSSDGMQVGRGNWESEDEAENERANAEAESKLRRWSRRLMLFGARSPQHTVGDYRLDEAAGEMQDGYGIRRNPSGIQAGQTIVEAKDGEFIGQDPMLEELRRMLRPKEDAYERVAHEMRYLGMLLHQI
ncbi:uncharacterized protein VTP21DRAFT_5063 [Calcarisporiella thermophila]|uniref:uncharacterized protein n=1 Tax=Calcarisporiella thermophila TaxID=911321 RepID=UPI003743A00E